MQRLRNIVVGFLVSYIGSVPLGYLNVIGYDLYSHRGLEPVLLYLAGVVAVEAVVIWATVVFAAKLRENTRLIRYIELFSIVFLLALAWSFYAAPAAEAQGKPVLPPYVAYPPLMVGLLASSLNFVQIPFWTGWNLYLVNADRISVVGNSKFGYIGGTLVGTFLGMLTLILCLDWFSRKNDFVSAYLMSAAVPLLFLGMALFQALRFWQKYGRRKP